MSIFYGPLLLYATIGFCWSILGYMNDHNNRYPLPLMLSAIAAGALSQALI